MSKTFKTPKGTVLPLLNLKGKDYLQCQQRVIWFREEKPDWGIETEFLQLTENVAIAKATIRDEKGRIIAQGTKSETPSGFPDYIEKAESSAVGRALALIGYGTQFCADELDEGERLADSPATPRGPSPLKAVPPQPQAPRHVFDLGEFQINFGRKYLGKRLKDIPREEVLAYIEWLEQKAEEKGEEPHASVVLLKDAADRFYFPEKYKSKEPTQGAGPK